MRPSGVKFLKIKNPKFLICLITLYKRRKPYIQPHQVLKEGVCGAISSCALNGSVIFIVFGIIVSVVTLQKITII